MGEQEKRSPVSKRPDVLAGETVFAGTRVPLDVMLAYRRDGCSIDEFLLDFPSVEPWQARAVWEMADGEITRLITQGDSACGNGPG